MKSRLSLVAFGLLAVAVATNPSAPLSAAAAPLKVVATTEDLAALAMEVGGDRVTVESIA
ncbi:MAG TPA: hypothetical protein VMZ90_04475 [Vicinamibacterales bacterium]|nr:hypothetical protein [Vicinamibacterales bacterium]